MEQLQRKLDAKTAAHKTAEEDLKRTAKVRASEETVVHEHSHLLL